MRRVSPSRLLAISLVAVVSTGACASRRSEHDIAAAAVGAGALSVAPVAAGGPAIADGGTVADGAVSGAGAASPSSAPSATVKGSNGTGAAPIGTGTTSAAPGTGAAGTGRVPTGSAAERGSPATPRASAAAPVAADGRAPGPAGSNAAPAGRSDPLRVGSVSTLSGPVGASLGGGAKAVQAWVAWINAKGGLAGHPVELSVADDGSDPARHRALVQEMAEQKGVVAFVHNSAPLSGQAGVSYIQQKRIPVIGSEGGSRWVSQNSMYFPQMSSDPLLADVNAGGFANTLVPQNKRKVAFMYCAEVQGCRAGASKAAFEKVGLQVVYEAQVSIAAPDYTAQCLGARNAGAEGVFVAVDTQSIGRLATNCASVGFKPTFGWPAQVTSDSQLARPELDGAIVANAVAPWFLDTLPAVAEFRAAMTRFAPSVPIDGSAVQGWTSAKLLERAGRSLAAATSAEILKGLWSISGDDLGGLTYPLAFKETDPNNGVSMRMCFFDVRIQSGRWASPDGGQRHCTP